MQLNAKGRQDGGHVACMTLMKDARISVGKVEETTWYTYAKENNIKKDITEMGNAYVCGVYLFTIGRLLRAWYDEQLGY
jgi:hypothetical protein